MVKVVVASQDLMAKETVDRLLRKDFPVRDPMNFIAFDASQIPLNEIARECEYLPLGCDRKAVVLEKATFLAERGKWKPQASDNPDAFLSYLRHPNPDCDLYLTVVGSLNTKSEFYKALQEGKAQFLAVEAMDEKKVQTFLPNFLAKRGVKVSNDAVMEFANRVGDDYGKTMNEAEKLAAYAGNGGTISLSDVETLITPKLEDDAWSICYALSSNDTKRALAIYKDLKVSRNIDEVTLIGMLTRQFLQMDMVRYLVSQGYSSNDISMKLGISSGRAYHAVKDLRRVRAGGIQKAMEQLYQTDRQILSGKVAAPLAFQLFLANFSL